MFLIPASESVPYPLDEGSAFEASHAPRKRKPILRTQLAQDALRLVQSRLPVRLRESELVEQLGAGIRVIQISFRAQYGESIKSATTRLLLEGARTELLRIPYQRGEVRRVALIWGFNHVGRFAVAYRLRFGETPVQTCRKTQPVSPAADVPADLS